jgi:hypothetical protein
LGVAVWTEQSEVGQPVVVASAVDVIELERHWHAVPPTSTTDFALLPLQASGHQPRLEAGCSARPTIDENLVKPCRRDGRRALIRLRTVS